jgi:hypothetical protein
MGLTVDQFQTYWELYRRNPIPYNRERLFDSIAAVFRSGEFNLALVGPLVGTVSALLDERPSKTIRGATARLLINASVAAARHFGPLCGRPAWNDYEMARWMLRRDPRYLSSLYKQVHSGERPGDPEHAADEMPQLVWTTGHWMLGSVAQTDPEFAKQFSAFTRWQEEQRAGCCEECRQIATGSVACPCCGGHKVAAGSADYCSVCEGTGRVSVECANAVRLGFNRGQ